jgi:hypothetical protein
MTHAQRLNRKLLLDDGQEFSPCDHVIPAKAGIHASSGPNPSSFQASSLKSEKRENLRRFPRFSR